MSTGTVSNIKHGFEPTKAEIKAWNDHYLRLFNERRDDRASPHTEREKEAPKQEE